MNAFLQGCSYHVLCSTWNINVSWLIKNKNIYHIQNTHIYNEYIGLGQWEILSMNQWVNKLNFVVIINRLKIQSTQNETGTVTSPAWLRSICLLSYIRWVWVRIQSPSITHDSPLSSVFKDTVQPLCCSLINPNARTLQKQIYFKHSCDHQ